VIAILLNLRIALSMRNRDWKDFVFAATIVPAEVYMWVRLGHFFRAWSKFLSRKQTDNWAAQAKAERGSGNGYLAPVILAVLIMIALVVGWFLLPVVAQSSILWVGWPILGTITALQTVSMFFKLIRRHRGYRV
jgi:biofilm PGA synthesis N-glycosyltransferase PgaC